MVGGGLPEVFHYHVEPVRFGVMEIREGDDVWLGLPLAGSSRFLYLIECEDRRRKRDSCRHPCGDRSPHFGSVPEQAEPDRPPWRSVRPAADAVSPS
jgi:hypothetical protein